MRVDVPKFSRGGLGVSLAGVFEGRLRRRPCLWLSMPRGRQFLIVCDIGGSQKDQPFETLSFLVLDLDANARWLAGQRTFRTRILTQPRRMAFKAFNDRVRRRALMPFLTLAETLNGILVTFLPSTRSSGRSSVTAAPLGRSWRRSGSRRSRIGCSGSSISAPFSSADCPCLARTSCSSSTRMMWPPMCRSLRS